nr:WxcM-like domain-containing protein [uncultured Flavobacterium sp.]
MFPKLLKGNSQEDSRGILFYNNDFDASAIKRIYVIENTSTEFVRAWRGHQIEQRWFSAIKGSFKIQLLAVDDWDTPSKKLERLEFVLDSKKLDVLHIPAGYVSSIQSLAAGSKLLIMANFALGELEDEYRYASDYFE